MPDIRSAYFKHTGMYSNDDVILTWFYDNVVMFGDLPQEHPVSSGGPTDFYDIKNCKDVDDIAEHWDLRGDEFNCLKAIAGIALGSRHSGTSPLRDANKLVHYALRIQSRLEKDSHAS